MNFVIGVILFFDIALIFQHVYDMYIGVALYFIVYFFIYIGLKRPFKLGIMFNIFYFTWVIVRPLLLLCIILNLDFH